MHRAANHTRWITLLVVCHMVGAGQTADLAPLLPPATAATQGIRQAVTAGDLAQAAVLVENLPETHRNLWRGILAIVRNDSTGAIRILRHAGQPKALGVAYYLARQHLLFREQMAEAIRKTPDDFAPYYYLGRHYDSDVDNAEEAAKWFRLALRRNGAYARARYHLGNCLERMGQVADAESEYVASITIAQSMVGLARLRLAEGRAASALEYVEKAIKMDSRDAGAAKLAARIYGALDRPRDAIAALETAAVLAPRDAPVRYQLWRAYQAAGESAKAAAALSEFERLRSIYGIKP